MKVKSARSLSFTSFKFNIGVDTGNGINLSRCYKFSLKNRCLQVRNKYVRVVTSIDFLDTDISWFTLRHFPRGVLFRELFTLSNSIAHAGNEITLEFEWKSERKYILLQKYVYAKCQSKNFYVCRWNSGDRNRWKRAQGRFPNIWEIAFWPCDSW